MILLYLLGLLALGIYSYSQIDLNLTLLQTPWFLDFKNAMIGLGYYNRPLSAFLMLTLLVTLFGSYIYLIKKADKLSLKTIIIGLSGVAVVGLLSYPGFSHDFFNYLFDARIVSTYGQNPYLVMPQDFVGDPWLRFMHWIHRTYPYGPGWLVATVPLTFIGMGKFVLTLLIFKLGFVINYLASVFLLWKITRSKKLVVFFAFNPLVVIESVISPHIDSVMNTLLLATFYFYQSKKLGLSMLFTLLSASIKYLTIVTLPFLFWKWPLDKVARFTIGALFIALSIVIVQREFYPWYLLPVLGAAAVISKSNYLRPFLVALSLGLLLQYLPYIYTGSYLGNTQVAKIVLLLLPILVWSIFAKRLAR